MLNGGTGCYTKSKTLNKRLHGPKILLSSLLDTALLEKSGSQTSTSGASSITASQDSPRMQKNSLTINQLDLLEEVLWGMALILQVWSA